MQIDIAGSGFRCWKLIPVYLCLVLGMIGCSTAPQVQDTPFASVADSVDPGQSQSMSQTRPVPSGPRYQLTPPSVGRNVRRPDLLVAQDLIGALKQVGNYGPGASVIRMPPIRSAFARAIQDALVAEGYQVEKIWTKTGRGVLLSSVIKKRNVRTNDQYTFILAIDRVALKRTYTLNGDFVAPATSLFVRGADPRSIALNDDIFVGS